MHNHPKLRATVLALLLLLGTVVTLAAIQLRSQRSLAAAMVTDDPEAPSWTPSADGLTVALTGPAGTVCTLLDSDGAALWVLRLDEDGRAETPQLSPGVYALLFRDGTRSAFSLGRNGSLTARTGDAALWTDGEVLHLADGPTGAISITKRLPADGWDGLDPTFLFQLTDADGQQWQQTLGFYEDLTPVGGWYSLTATFSGLPAGTYILTEIPLQDSSAAVTMDGQSAALPAEITLAEGHWTANVVSTEG